jgi:hypothetical protein
MTVFSANRTALFIDGANLSSTAKTLELIYLMGERRYPCRQAFRHFMNLLNRAVYGAAFRRYGKRLRVITRP